VAQPLEVGTLPGEQETALFTLHGIHPILGETNPRKYPAEHDDGTPVVAAQATAPA
jgi:hypothetical protein